MSTVLRRILDSGNALTFRSKLMLAMMLVVVAVTAAAVYIGTKNLRENQERVLDEQFHDQVGAFIALQEANSRAIAEKCRTLSQSVRLRAALEEHDTEDLYQNALTEMHSILEDDPRGTRPRSARASFFRFVDANGVLLGPGEDMAVVAGEMSFDEALGPIAHAIGNVSDQAVGFVAVTENNRPKAVRRVVVTKIRDQSEKVLGALLIGFPIRETQTAANATSNEMKSGILVSHRFYADDLSAPDRHVTAQRVNAATKQYPNGNFVIDLQSGSHLLFYQRLNPDSRLEPAYQVCLYPLAASIHETRVLRWKIIGFGVLVLCGGFLASLFLASNLSKPVDKLAATSAENFSRRKKAEEDLHETNRELEKALGELKATQQQVIQQERLSALGQMAAGIAHDFNNTLMPILGFADVLLRNDAMLDDKAEARRCLEMLRTSAQDAASVVSRLREFYRPAETEEEFPVVDLTRIIEQTVALTEPKWGGVTQARGLTVTVETKFTAQPVVAGEESALREVLTNLLFNAVDAMPDGGGICIATAIENDQAVIRVSDTGTGMTETVRQRCLEPFFSTKGDRGTGLGLSMVYGIIERHRGHLDIESAVGKGTTFIIRLPLADELPVQAVTTNVPAANSPLKVLVVDDEMRSREVLTVYLRTDNHSVVTASSGREALEKFKRGQFDLVIMDRSMPEMSGEQTARFIKQINRNVPVILLTGFSGAVEANGTDAIDVMLHKPITLDLLRQTIGKLVYAA